MTSKQQILDLLNTSNKAIARALVVLNERQVRDEQVSEQTRYQNGIGFTPADARMGTSMANFYSKFNRLSDKQIAYWRKPNVKGVPRINKYAGQLVEIAQEKAAAAVAKVMVPKVMVGDVGNLCEEQIAIQEQLDAYQEGALGEGPEQDMAMERLYDRLHSIKEQLEEIARCEYKMARDFG
jgi:hypothetical protein